MTVDISESRDRLINFLNNHSVGVLATVGRDGQPHAATVYITHDQVLNLYFISKKDTQKVRNIAENNKAALAIFDAESQTTMQAQGTIVEITSPEQTQWIFNDIWRIAAITSLNAAPPPAQLLAGGYGVYKLAAPSLRLARFIPENPAEYGDIFETTPTYPGA